jgi:hypothetical protein
VKRGPGGRGRSWAKPMMDSAEAPARGGNGIVNGDLWMPGATRRERQLRGANARAKERGRGAKQRQETTLRDNGVL